MKTAYKYLIINNNLTFLNNEIMKTQKKQPHQRVIKLCFTLAMLLSWNLSFGQGAVPNKDDLSTIRARSIVSNNDGSNHPNEYIYLRSGEDANNQWMTGAQMVIGNDFIRTRQPLQFLVGDNTWEGNSEYITNRKFLNATGDYGLTFSTNNQQRMTILRNSGFVGIGTNVPDHLLSISSNKPTDNSFLYGFEQTFNENDYHGYRLGLQHLNGRRSGLRLQLKNGGDYSDIMSSRHHSEGYNMTGFNGRVGIGTNDPDHLLDVYSDQGAILGVGKQRGGRVYIIAGTDGNRYAIGSRKKDKFGIMTNNITRMTLDTSGRVGIGTASPEVGLHVKDKDGGIMYEKKNIQVIMGLNSTNNAGWIGTESNNGLFLGTNNEGSNIYLDVHDNAFIGFENSNIPTLSSSNRENFDLMVDEGIIAEDLAIAERADWADYVFDEEYTLKPLSEVKQFIKKNKHLPNIPSQKEVSKKGYSVHDINVRLLEKTEELVLYAIQQEEKIEKQELKIKELSKRLDDLAKMITKDE